MSFDKLVGAGMIAAATVVFLYYTTWTFVLPFVDELSPIQSLFPPREWAIRIPLVLLLTALLGVGTFIGKVLIKSAEKEKRKKIVAKSK